VLRSRPPEELRPGLSTWTASHPDWTPEEGGSEGWEQEVRSYALDAGDSFVLFDPLVAVEDAERLAAGRPIDVLLTCRWHRRSSDELVERLGATVYSPAADADEVGIPVSPYGLADDLPGGVESWSGGYPNEATLWIPQHGALVVGDILLSGERGLRLQPDSWIPDGLTRAELAGRLEPLLDLPVELRLPTHGDPVSDDAKGALERALAG
jgi:hypothetical protein